MADRRTSEFDLLTSFTVDMYIPIIDPSEPLSEDRNKRFTLAQLFAATNTFSGTTETIGGSVPTLNVFTGSSTCTATLPAGSASIVNMPIYFCNLGTAFLNIDGNGSDTVDSGNSDPFEIPNGDRKVYTARWSGSTWLIQ